MGYVVEARGLVQRFGPITAVDELDLRIQEGEIYGLLGPNGSGKSTLIRLMLGLLKASAGWISVLGVPMPDRQTLGLMGYMPQSSSLYLDLTVWENVSFFATLTGMKSKTKIDEVLDLVDLAGRRDSLVATLSGGMRQRVSLACALVHGPKLLLLDEPTVGVDPYLRKSFWTHFRQLAANGTTIVVSSHVMDEADRCDRL
ncbi:MAG: ABC transporter ATP-binding protein, partial [Dehalococcoidia bacterium]|nr:ABC transporter ATP-binding protein [Dehalococcoidia bacterium]